MSLFQVNQVQCLDGHEPMHETDKQLITDGSESHFHCKLYKPCNHSHQNTHNKLYYYPLYSNSCCLD